jgi:hypothetical protein
MGASAEAYLAVERYDEGLHEVSRERNWRTGVHTSPLSVKGELLLRTPRAEIPKMKRRLISESVQELKEIKCPMTLEARVLQVSTIS